MSSKLFSIYDVSLLLLILQCFVIAANARMIIRYQGVSSVLLAVLFFCLSIYQLNNLLFWIGAFSHIYVYLFVLALGFTFGPLLYLVVQRHVEHVAEEEQVKSEGESPPSDANMAQLKNQLVHFIPLAIYPVYLLLLYVSLGNTKLYVAAQNFRVLWYDPLHVALVMSMLATQIAYSVLACRLYLHGQSSKSVEHGAGRLIVQNVLREPLLYLTVLFTFYWIWNVLAFVLSLIAAGEQVISVAGAVGNMLLFIFLARLGFVGGTNRLQSALKEDIEEKDGSENGKDPYRDEQVNRIASAMEENQLYLNPELTLEQLAEHAQIPPRLVSTIINRKFNKNFFEFTNSYRVNHAKDLLRTSDKGVSMLDIMADSGFNSKSAFNRFFKKYTEMTPTQYRQTQKKNKSE